MIPAAVPLAVLLAVTAVVNSMTVLPEEKPFVSSGNRPTLAMSLTLL